MLGLIILLTVVAALVIGAMTAAHMMERPAPTTTPCPEGWTDDRSTCPCGTCTEARIRYVRYHSSNQWGR